MVCRSVDVMGRYWKLTGPNRIASLLSRRSEVREWSASRRAIQFLVRIRTPDAPSTDACSGVCFSVCHLLCKLPTMERLQGHPAGGIPCRGDAGYSQSAPRRRFRRSIRCATNWTHRSCRAGLSFPAVSNSEKSRRRQKLMVSAAELASHCARLAIGTPSLGRPRDWVHCLDWFVGIGFRFAR